MVTVAVKNSIVIPQRMNHRILPYDPAVTLLAYTQKGKQRLAQLFVNLCSQPHHSQKPEGIKNPRVCAGTMPTVEYWSVL